MFPHQHSLYLILCLPLIFLYRRYFLTLLRKAFCICETFFSIILNSVVVVNHLSLSSNNLRDIKNWILSSPYPTSNKKLSAWRPRQVVSTKLSATSWRLGRGSFPKTSENCHTLTTPSVRKDIIEFCRYDVFKTFPKLTSLPLSTWGWNKVMLVLLH
jgi:hypothetical protein